MAVPGCKALFFLRKDWEICEDFGQKCELMDRNGQNSRLFFYLSSSLSNVGRLTGFFPRREAIDGKTSDGMD